MIFDSIYDWMRYGADEDTRRAVDELEQRRSEQQPRSGYGELVRRQIARGNPLDPARQARRQMFSDVDRLTYDRCPWDDGYGF